MTWINDPGKIHDLENSGSVCHARVEPAGGVPSASSRSPRKTLGPDAQTVSSAYVPTLQRTEGQPPPVAANGGLSYTSFDRDGDAGTAKALQDALAEIAAGESQRVIDMINNPPPSR